ncbi:MAG: YggS family pyridoxal phosphate-dependent enzyme [Omnitrophica WOR_2 bacterium]
MGQGFVNASLIAENYQKVLSRIQQTAQQAGRGHDSVRLVVVTKTHPVETIRAVLSAGARVLGENYAEDAVPKINAISDYPGIQWHMIGHIQSRKARLVCEHFDYVHSLDSLKLARLLDRFSGEYGKRLPVLLECNISGESSKSGWPAWREEAWSELLPSFSEVASLPNIQVCGLMTIPPLDINAEEARPYFKKLMRLSEFLRVNLCSVKWEELSMGMSADFEVAIQEGATWVRVGQAIFGPRLNT